MNAKPKHSETSAKLIQCQIARDRILAENARLHKISEGTARAPELLAENERLRAVNAELVAALQDMLTYAKIYYSDCVSKRLANSAEVSLGERVANARIKQINDLLSRAALGDQS